MLLRFIFLDAHFSLEPPLNQFFFVLITLSLSEITTWVILYNPYSALVLPRSSIFETNPRHKSIRTGSRRFGVVN